MRYGIVLGNAILLVAAVVCGGTVDQTSRYGATAASHAGWRAGTLEQYGIELRGAIRVREDKPRTRIWVLTLDDVRIYDLESKRPIAVVPIPPWSVVRGACAPDLTLDDRGAAYFASNAQPTIWRIDPLTFKLEEREVRLERRETWAVGFGLLHFSTDGKLLAMTSSANSLWLVDFGTGTAKLIAEYRPPLGSCTLPAPAIGGFLHFHFRDPGNFDA
jgi:hypothetical protein